MRHTLLFALVWLLALAAQATWGLGDTFPPGYDQTHEIMYPAWEFIKNGVFPDHGGINSRNGYNPPAYVWFHIVPMLLTSNLSLVLLLPSLTLHALALLLLYRFARRHLGPWPGLCAVVLYAFSTLGLYYGHSRWAFAYPPLYVLFLYSFSRWYLEDKEWSFSVLLPLTALISNVQWRGAILWGVLAVLMVLFKKRPRLWPALLGSSLALAISFPFLRFETTRRFEDFRIAVGGHAAASPPEDVTALCASPEAPAPVPSPLKTKIKMFFSNHGPTYALLRHAYHLVRGLPGWLLLPEVNFNWQSVYAPKPSLKERILLVYSSALFLYGLAILARRVFGGGAASPAERLLFWSFLVPAVAQELTGYGSGMKPTASALFYAPQVLIVSHALTAPAWAVRRSARAVIVAALGALVLAECLDAYERIAAWKRGGTEPMTYRIVDLIAADLRGQGRTSAAIRYDSLIDRPDLCWEATFGAMDERAAVGNAFNFLLEYRHGMKNDQVVPDGWAPDPDYVVVNPRGVQRYDLTSGRYTLLDAGVPTLLKVVKR